ncbi:hypothetical protein RJ640_030967 [Escallonia rubra]|uniref:Uncharacterized protein n=1 Tax=Escallonia rubra TaxID=112253 RepID=A0AA88S0S7_9ASTE|nr:hypothetical protein RJ640_030967 [Escallonia rubra]
MDVYGGGNGRLVVYGGGRWKMGGLRWLVTMEVVLVVYGVGADSSIMLNLPSKQQGLVRYCTSTLPSDGGNAATTLWCHEMLVAVDAAGRRLTYEVVDNNMGFKQYLSTIKLSPIDGDDKPSCEIEFWEIND